MVYSNRFVSTIKVGGKVLRESAGTVTIPFGAEYSIYLKNMNSVRAMAKVSVDGKDATEGTWLIIPANGSLELERFIRNGNWDQGNRFKFIDRTSEIEAHRGVGSEDGLVRVEFKVEKVTVVEHINHEHHHHHHDDYYDYWPWRRRWGSPYWDDRIIGSSTLGSNDEPTLFKSAPDNKNFVGKRPERKLRASGASLGVMRSMKATPMKVSLDISESALVNDAGITVAGGESNQKFVAGAWFPTVEPSEVIVIRLRGEIGDKPVVQAVTVEHKPTCSTCGRTNKATNKFCSNCGTALILI